MSYDIWLEREGEHIELFRWVDVGSGPTGTVIAGHIDDDGEFQTVENGFCGNYTSNVSAIWALALKEVDGKLDFLGAAEGENAGECADQLEAAGRYIVDNPEIFKPMNPSNGWGDYKGAAGYLLSIALACRENPDTTIGIWR